VGPTGIKYCRLEVGPSHWLPTNDGSYNVGDIHWTGWTDRYAAGVATASSRVCWGNCFKRVTFSAYLLFSDPVDLDGHLVFARGDVISLNPSDAGHDMIDRGALDQSHLPEAAVPPG